MTDSTADVATLLACSWNATRDGAAVALDFWPCCRILHDGGVLDAQEEQLAAVALGPFRIAVHRSSTPTRDFIEVLLPSVIAGVPAGQTVNGAVAGVLSAACACFLALTRHGVVLGRGEADRLRWDVLMLVRTRNLAGEWPTGQDVAAALREPAAGRTVERIDAALGWLTSTGAPVEDRPQIRLIAERGDGGLECLV